MNWFDLLVIIVVGVTLFTGYLSGIIMQLASLAGLLLGAIFAGQLSKIVAPEILSLTHVSQHIIGPLSYIIAFVAILVGIYFAGKLLEKFVEAIQINTLNRLAGALFSTIKWIIVFSILLNLLVEFDQNQQMIKEDVRLNSVTYPFIIEIAKTVIPFLRFDWAA